MNPKAKTRVADAMLLLTAAIWGVGFPATKQALECGFGASSVIFLRFSLASLILLAFFWRRLCTITRAELRQGVIAGVLLFGGYIIQTLSMVFTEPSHTAFITATYVIMVPFVLWAMYHRRPPAKSFVASLITLLGIVVLTGGVGESMNLGDLLSLLCAVVFTLHLCYLGHVAQEMDTVKLTFLQVAVVAGLSLLLMLWLDGETLPQADWAGGWLPIAYMAVFGTCLCFFLQTFGQKHTTSTKASILLCTESLFGSLFSVCLGFEPVTLHMLAGGLLLFGAIVLVESNLFQKHTGA